MIQSTQPFTLLPCILNNKKNSISGIIPFAEIMSVKKKNISLLLFVIAIFILLLTDACWRQSTPSNVILITIDTLRADALSCYNIHGVPTPNIDTLAKEGTIFKEAISPVPITLPSHCSIMTGTYPSYHTVHHNSLFKLPDSALTLAEVLKNNGYQTAAFIGAFPLASVFNINQGFDTYDEHFNVKPQQNEYFFAERRAEDVINSAKKWLQNPQSKPWFVWIHLFDPHQPYQPPDPYKQIYQTNPYYGEIAYVDHCLGKFMDFLKTAGKLNNTLIVLTSDHGEALGEHGEVNHSTFIYDTTLKVPLIFWAQNSRLRNKIVTSSASLVDIMPTILDYLHFQMPLKCQGTSLLGLIKEENHTGQGMYIETYAPYLDYKWSPLICWLQYPYKYIKAPKEELYRLDNDPNELNNLTNSLPWTAARMRSSLEAFLASQKSLSQKPSNLSNDNVQSLRSLGYISFQSSLPNTDSLFALPDPKNNTYVIRKIAFLTSSHHAPSELISEYQNILMLDKNNPLINFRLAYAYYRNEQFDKAEYYFSSLIKNDSMNADTYVGLAASLAKQNKIDESISVLQDAINNKYMNDQVYYNLAELLLFKKQNAQAIEYYRKALEVNPSFQPALTRLHELTQ